MEIECIIMLYEWDRLTDDVTANATQHEQSCGQQQQGVTQPKKQSLIGRHFGNHKNVVK